MSDDLTDRLRGIYRAHYKRIFPRAAITTQEPKP